MMTKGAVVFVKGLNKDTSREDIKNFFQEFGTVAWVEYAKGDEKVRSQYL